MMYVKTIFEMVSLKAKIADFFPRIRIHSKNKTRRWSARELIKEVAVVGNIHPWG